LQFFLKKNPIYQDTVKTSEAHLKNHRMLCHVHEIGLRLFDILSSLYMDNYSILKNFFISTQSGTNLGHCWKGFSQYGHSFARVQILALCSVKQFLSYSFTGHWGLP
jgi:hypothetical protein